MSRNVFLILLALLFKCPGIFAQPDVIKTIYFKPGQYKLDSSQVKSINAMLKGGELHGFLKIFGYADTTGPEAYNDRLSGLRAEEVLHQIRSKVKLDEKSLYVTWLGESADVYDLHFPDAHAQQRCVDIWIIR